MEKFFSHMSSIAFNPSYPLVTDAKVKLARWLSQNVFDFSCSSMSLWQITSTSLLSSLGWLHLEHSVFFALKADIQSKPLDISTRSRVHVRLQTAQKKTPSGFEQNASSSDWRHKNVLETLRHLLKNITKPLPLAHENVCCKLSKEKPKKTFWKNIESCWFRS